MTTIGAFAGTLVNSLRERNTVAIVLMEVDISGLSRRELTARQITSDWRISVVYGHMVGNRVVPSVNLSTHCAHVTGLGLLDVLLVSTPAFLVAAGNDHIAHVVERLSISLHRGR